MYESIPLNTPTASKRRIYFFLPQTDGITPATGKTGKVRLTFNGAASADSTNNIVELSAANLPGEYYLELTQAEANTGVGIVRGSLAPAGCARIPIQGFITPDDIYVAALTANDLSLHLFRTFVLDAKFAGLTFEEVMLVVSSALAGKNSGMQANSPVFRDLADSSNVISGTLDGNKNRTAVVLTP